MTGTSYAFILTKSSDLLLHYFPFFFICTIMLFYSGYHEAFDPGEDSIQEMLEDWSYQI
jgi:hypothetical protein